MGDIFDLLYMQLTVGIYVHKKGRSLLYMWVMDVSVSPRRRSGRSSVVTNGSHSLRVTFWWLLTNPSSIHGIIHLIRCMLKACILHELMDICFRRSVLMNVWFTNFKQKSSKRWERLYCRGIQIQNSKDPTWFQYTVRLFHDLTNDGRRQFMNQEGYRYNVQRVGSVRHVFGIGMLVGDSLGCGSIVNGTAFCFQKHLGGRQKVWTQIDKSNLGVLKLIQQDLG
mmetsp:Transcript_2460/g.3336  ORF Transcript_2460/g.3336 Transcript_2460/m.3336 type:complete len:224 (-) Transcript_2460:699-1370(-)